MNYYYFIVSDIIIYHQPGILPNINVIISNISIYSHKYLSMHNLIRTQSTFLYSNIAESLAVFQVLIVTLITTLLGIPPRHTPRCHYV